MSNMKRKVLGVLLVVLSGSLAYATTIPADGDAWTEDSTTGWTAGTAQATDCVVGDYSMKFYTLSNYPGLEYTNSTSVDVSGPGAYVDFYWKVVFTGEHNFKGQVSIYSEGATGHLSQTSLFDATGTLDWREFKIDLSGMSEYGTDFDSTKVNKIRFAVFNPTPDSPWMGDGYTTQYVDGLYFVPEPATLTLIAAGGILSLTHKKRK